MKFLTTQAQREAVNMRVIAIMTFLLLPATFVSVSALVLCRYLSVTDFAQTFFSTDVVKYQNDGNQNNATGESYSSLAMQRWFEVAVPLTVVTLGIAGCLLYWETVKKWPKWLLCYLRHRESDRLADEEEKTT